MGDIDRIKGFSYPNWFKKGSKIVRKVQGKTFLSKLTYEPFQSIHSSIDHSINTFKKEGCRQKDRKISGY